MEGSNAGSCKSKRAVLLGGREVDDDCAAG
jgi:hypothetical protein